MKPSELIKKYGWIQHELGSEAMGYCIVGAVHASFKRKSLINRLHLLDSLTCNLDIHSLSEWNDDPLRTKEEVIEFLEKRGY